MKKSANKLLEKLSIECFGNKYYYKKLMKTGLLYDKKCINPNGPKAKAYTAKRLKMTEEGVRMYMKRTINNRNKTEELK